MRVRRGLRSGGDKIDLNMTPMIDIVFQLLTFFIMSLRISAAEGDFQVRLPQGVVQRAVEDRDSPLFRLRLTAAADGSLRAMKLDGRMLAERINGPEQSDAAFRALHAEVLARVGDARGPGSLASQAEVEIDCDYELDYQHVIAAITAVSGYVSPSDDGGVVRLIEKIKFAPPRG